MPHGRPAVRSGVHRSFTPSAYRWRVEAKPAHELRHQPPAIRVRQGVALLAGAAVLQLAVAGGPLSFFWTPFFVGLAYLGAALAGGPRGGYWATAAVFLPWGTVVAALSELRGLDVRIPAAYITALGLGAMLAGFLQRRGFALDLVGVGGAIVLAGLFFGLDRYWVTVLGRADTYAVLLAVIGIWSLAAARRAPRQQPA